MSQFVLALFVAAVVDELAALLCLAIFTAFFVAFFHLSGLDE